MHSLKIEHRQNTILYFKLQLDIDGIQYDSLSGTRAGQ